MSQNSSLDRGGKRRSKKVNEAAAKLNAKVFRDIKKRLRAMMNSYAIVFVAFRLNITPAVAEKMLSGETDLTLEQLCDLARSVDCRLVPKITPRKP